ncbi:MAG TPA: Fic family protein [bacterium]|nr:Fic family protein [bacterium]
MDLTRANPMLWVMLGECQSKCEHISGVPLQPDTVEELHLMYLAKGVKATTAIEGNTLSEDEVMKQIRGELFLPPSREYLKQETQNIIDECNRITDEIVAARPPALTTARIKELNAAVLKGLTPGEGVVPGEIREHSVVVGLYRGAPAQDCEYLLDRLCEWLGSDTFAPPRGMEIIYAIIKAVMAHLYMAWIHPFGDGNGRTARLIEFQLLIASGVSSPAAHLLSNHYNQTRTEYYRQLDRASGSGGEVLQFLEYAAQGFLDGLRAQIQLVQEQQMRVTWRDYVYEAFRHKRSAVNARRRNLVLELSNLAGPVSVSQLMELSPRIAREYALKTEKALSRDINELIKMGLVQKDGRGVSACRELILAFLPVKAGATSCASDDLKRK